MMAVQRFSRRSFVGGSVGGFFAFAARHPFAQGMLRHAAAQGAKRCVVLWMNGGPSQFETFDPKPGTATGGELSAISTDVSGLKISETLPNMATRMKHLNVVRNLTSTEGEHIRGQYYLHTGFKFVPAFPRPALGAVVSHQTPETDFPRYVSIGGRGYGPAYLGPDHAPFGIENPAEAKQLLDRIRRRRGRVELLQDLSAEFDASHPTAAVDRRRALIGRIEQLVTTPFVKALDLTAESESTRNRYGEGEFARGCLLARRLLEAGVNFVEVQHDGWDTHSDNFRATQRLCGQIDQPWACLMDDLHQSGLLEETVVVWMGEFGRTPRINANRGRDHFPAVSPVVIGGAGMSGGQAIGATNRAGTEIDGDSYQVADLFATVFSKFGVSPHQEFTTSFGSPTEATDGGKVINELA